MLPCGPVGENEPPRTEDASPVVPVASQHIQQAVKSLMLKMKQNPEAVAKVMQSLPSLVKDNEMRGSKANSLIAAMAAANLDPTRVHVLQEQLKAASSNTGGINSSNVTSAANTTPATPVLPAAPATPAASPPPQLATAAAADKKSAIAAAAAMLTAHRRRKAQQQQQQGLHLQPSAALLAQLQKSFGALQQQQTTKQFPGAAQPVSPQRRFTVGHNNGPGAATGGPPLLHGVVGVPSQQHGFSAAGLLSKTEGTTTGLGSQQMMSIADLRQALGGLVAAQNGTGNQLAASTGLLSQAVAAANANAAAAGTSAVGTAVNQQGSGTTQELTPLALQAMMSKVLNARGAQRGLAQRGIGAPFPGDGRNPVKAMQAPMNRQRFQQLSHPDLASSNGNAYPPAGHNHQAATDGASSNAQPYMSQYPPGVSGIPSQQLPYPQPRRDGGYMNRPSPFGVSTHFHDQQAHAMNRYRQGQAPTDRHPMPTSLNDNNSHGQYVPGNRVPSVFQAGGPRGPPRMAPPQHATGSATSAFTKEKVLEDWQRNVLCAVAYGSQLQASVSQTRFGDRLPGLLANLAEDSATASHVFDAILTGASRAVLKEKSDGPRSADLKMKRYMRARPSTVQVWNESGVYMGRSCIRNRGSLKPSVASEKRKWFERIFDSKRGRRRRRYAHMADAIRYNHQIEEFNSEESDVEEILRGTDSAADDLPESGDRKRGLDPSSSEHGPVVDGRVVKRVCSENVKSGGPFAVVQGSIEECEWLFDGAGVAEQLALCFHPRPDNPLRQELMKLKWSLRSPLLEPIPENVSKEILNFQVPKLVRSLSESLPEYYFSATIAASRAESNILAGARNTARLNTMGAAVASRFAGRSSRDSGFVCAKDAVGNISSSAMERVRNRFISVANSNRRTTAAAIGGATSGGGLSGKGLAAAPEFSGDCSDRRVAEPEVSLSSYAEKIGQANSPEDVIDGVNGAATEGERPFDLVKKYTGWHPYVWFLMCRRPEMYSLGVEAGLVAKIAGEEWGGLQRQNRVLGFLQRVLEFVHEHPVPRTSDKKAMKVYKQLAAKIVRTPLMGSTTTAMRAALFIGSGGPSGSGGSECEEEDVGNHSRRSCVTGRRAASVAAAAVIVPSAGAVVNASVAASVSGGSDIVKDENSKHSNEDDAEDTNWQ